MSRSFHVFQDSDGYELNLVDEDTTVQYGLTDVDGSFLFTFMVFFIHNIYDNTRFNNA